MPDYLIPTYSILRNNPKPAVGRWGRWAGEENLIFLLAVLYILCCVVFWILFYFI